MVMTLAIPLRAVYRLEDFITMRHIDNMAKVMLATGLIVAYGYAMEAFFAWYSGNLYERLMMLNRMTGPTPFYWSLIVINVGLMQMFWFRSVRDNVPLLFVLSLFVNVGMWLERFIIIVTSLHRDFLPSSWDMYYPTRWDFLTYFGTIGLFLSLFFLFIRFLPMIAIFEMRTIVPEAKVESEHGTDLPRMAQMTLMGEGDGTRREQENALYGLMAEFDPVQSLVDARSARLAGFTKMDAYSPIPVEELNDVLHKKRTRLPRLVLRAA